MHHHDDPRKRARPDGRRTTTHLTVEIHAVISATEALSVEARFTYDPADPLAVRMDFPSPQDRVPPWFFSRDLLSAGLLAPSGDGDVRVWPPCRCHGPTTVRILLRGGRAAAVLYVPAAALQDWLETTYTVVPAGEEDTHLCLDEVVRRLLGHG
ncbi:SsgA family sporulation/cell division regulator [Streptomyces sp. NPDC004542]|uniref:SsgA family sporulation/cell division regulator n=1 Tax=Streptomyces sp. NPDC004542 TaxID=3154281 RepID=UPI0033A4EFE9